MSISSGFIELLPFYLFLITFRYLKCFSAGERWRFLIWNKIIRSKWLLSNLFKRTELMVNWPQPRCPLHAPKLLWSRLTKATVGHIPEQSGPKWDGLSVLFEKRMLHLWLVALCVHVVMWSSIRPSSHRYHTERLWYTWIWTGWFFFLWDRPLILCR